MTKAFALDIDGVLLKGSRVIPSARKALNLLNKYSIPWIVLTNGGGTSEKHRVSELSRKLGVKIETNRFLQSHTPYRDLVNNKNRILAIGGKQSAVRDVALEYGFPDVVTPQQLAAADPMMLAFPSLTSTMAGYNRMLDGRIDLAVPFDAIFVFHDSYDFSADIQLAIDMLLS